MDSNKTYTNKAMKNYEGTQRKNYQEVTDIWDTIRKLRFNHLSYEGSFGQLNMNKNYVGPHDQC